MTLRLRYLPRDVKTMISTAVRRKEPGFAQQRVKDTEGRRSCDPRCRGEHAQLGKLERGRDFDAIPRLC